MSDESEHSESNFPGILSDENEEVHNFLRGQHQGNRRSRAHLDSFSV